MEEKAYIIEMLRARAIKEESHNPEYWDGYLRGLRRQFHGDKFGTESEHQLWLTMSGDEFQRQRSEGYRAGYSKQ